MMERIRKLLQTSSDSDVINFNEGDIINIDVSNSFSCSSNSALIEF